MSLDHELSGWVLAAYLCGLAKRVGESLGKALLPFTAAIWSLQM